MQIINFQSEPTQPSEPRKRLSRKLQKYCFLFIIDFDAEKNQECMSNEFLV